MILFVFEGQKEEPRVMATIKQLFFYGKEDQVHCSFGCDTYTLFKEVQNYAKNGGEPDVFEIVRERLHTRNDHSLDNFYSYQFDSIYLFFDYDPQNTTISLEILNSAVKQMLETFSDPMGNGLLLVSYPMTEAIYCEDTIPDSNYLCSSVSLDDCCHFKDWCNRYALARKRGCLVCPTDKAGIIREPITDTRRRELLNAWNELILMNVSKANSLCNSSSVIPLDETYIQQSVIFEKQLDLFVNPKKEVAILSAYPLFLFEYFHGNGSI